MEKSWPQEIRPPLKPYLTQFCIRILRVLQENGQSMPNANLAALSATITK
jgi:hypothetical protein